MRTVDAIILARGGSKRIPRKNLTDICGLPLVAWSVIQAVNSRHITRVWCSTDDDEIADVAEKYGATIIRRPTWACDNAWAAGVPTSHALHYISTLGINLDLCMSVLPTSPLRMPSDFDRTIEAYCNAPEVEQPNWKAARPMARPHDIMLYKDNGDLGSDAIWSTKTDDILLLGGGYSLLRFDDYLINERKQAERLGTRFSRDEDLDAAWMSGGKIESPAGAREVGVLAEVDPWQVFELDVPSQIPQLQDVMQHMIVARGGVKLYEDYKGKA